MNSYPEYKDSGIEWIGEIPMGWAVNRISRITYVKGRVGWKGLTSNEFIEKGPYLVTGTDFKNGRIDWSKSYHVNQHRYEEDPFIILENDDVLITKDGTIGKLAHVIDLPGPATINSGIFVARPLNNCYLQRYFFWVLNSRIFDEYVKFSSSGTTIQHLYQNVFERFVLPIPNILDQSYIVGFLDKKTSQINSLIEKIEKKIELLKEYRVVLISQCVTKGLDPDVELKDSGIEWIGEIPRHWELKRLKFVCDYIIEKRAPSKTEIKISPENVEAHTGKVLSLFSNYESEGQVFREGDILFNKLRVYLNKVVLSKWTGLSMGEMIVLRPNSVWNEFLFRVLSSGCFINYVDSLSEGVKMPRPPVKGILNVLVPIPHETDQVQISRFIYKKTTQVDSLIEKLEIKIKLLKEYRQSLISNVVTGKVRVSEQIV